MSVKRPQNNSEVGVKQSQMIREIQKRIKEKIMCKEENGEYNMEAEIKKESYM